MTIETAILGLVLLYGIYQFVFTIGYLLRHEWRLRLLHKQAYILEKSGSTTSSSDKFRDCLNNFISSQLG